MNRKHWLSLAICAILLLLLTAGLSMAQGSTNTAAASPPQGTVSSALDVEESTTISTAFTYQGQLLLDGAPTTATCDFSFLLFDASEGGSQVGDSPQSVPGVDVVDGLFTVELDFGPGAFDGAARWLGIWLDCGGGLAPLAPRQPLSAAPAALTLRPTALISDTAALPLLRTYNTGSGAGISGRSVGGIGVYGQSDTADTSMAAIYGLSLEHAAGVYGESAHGHGVQGNGGDEPGDYGGHFLGHGGVFGSGEGAPGGYFESATDDAVYAHGDVTITGNLSVGGYANLPQYQNVVVVAKSGGDFTTINAALSSISDNSADRRYLVWVAPGVYYELVNMKPYVDIQGAGEVATKIEYRGFTHPADGTVSTADDSELRFLTVENTGGDDFATAIHINGTSPRLTHVTALASGSWIQSIGVHMEYGAPTLIDVTAVATGGSISHGVYNARSSPTMTNLTASGRDGTSNNGVYNLETAPVMVNMTASASGGTSNHGLYNHHSSPIVRRSSISASDGLSYGIYNRSVSGTYTVTIDSCQITAASHTVFNNQDPGNYVTMVGASLLSGGTVTGTGTITCAGIYDENYAFHSDTCP
jgi:hypothetical protein